MLHGMLSSLRFRIASGNALWLRAYFGLSGKRFGSLNALEFWKCASARRKAGRL